MSLLEFEIQRAAGDLVDVWLDRDGRGKRIEGRIDGWLVGRHGATVASPDLPELEIIKIIPEGLSVGVYGGPRATKWQELGRVIFDSDGKTSVFICSGQEKRIKELFDDLNGSMIRARELGGVWPREQK